MTELSISGEARYDDDELSLLALGSALLRHRRTIVGLGLLGAAVGFGAALASPRLYSSDATFIPQGSDASSSGLALTASQFGIRVPTGTNTWGPPIYVELLHSRALLEPILSDTVTVVEKGGRRFAVPSLFGVEETNKLQRTERGVRALGRIVAAAEDKKLGAVRLSVTTQWPSVSLALADRLVRGVNQFNLETRKSQAAAERQFAEIQAGEAERTLRAAEDRLQSFLQQNRGISGSPELGFQRDRLQREVALRQQMYTTLLQNREEAKLREVRDTPVITVLESPQQPLVSEPRKYISKGVLGALAGAIVGALIAFLAHAFSAARREPSDEAREFFRLVDEATPRFLKRQSR